MRLRVAAKRKATFKSTFTANTRICVSQLLTIKANITFR